MKKPEHRKIVTSAHRLSYEMFVGCIPRDLDVEHTCRNRRIELKEAIMKGTIRDAALEYVLRRDRGTNPIGTFDDAGRWFPDRDLEWRDCCDDIRHPSRQYPYSLMTHCRTIVHVANLYGKDPRRVRRAARRLDQERGATRLSEVGNQGRSA